MIIYECWGLPGQKDDSCIIRNERFLPTGICIKKNQFNTFHADSTNESPNKWNIITPIVHFKSTTSTARNSTKKRYGSIVSYIIGKRDHYEVGNGDIELYLSDSMPEPYKITINSEEN